MANKVRKIALLSMWKILSVPLNILGSVFYIRISLSSKPDVFTHLLRFDLRI